MREVSRNSSNHIHPYKRKKGLPRTSVELLGRQEAFDSGAKSVLASAIRKSPKTIGVRSSYGGGIVGAGDLYYFLEKGIPGVT